VTSCVKTEEK